VKVLWFVESVDEFADHTFDYMLTVCDNTKETCPILPGQRLRHRAPCTSRVRVPVFLVQCGILDH
jgi:hypothetical protein